MKIRSLGGSLTLAVALSALTLTSAFAQKTPAPSPSPSTPPPSPSPSTPAPSPSPTPPPTAEEAYSTLHQDGLDLLNAVRSLVCVLPGQEASLRAADEAYLDKIHAYEKTYFPRTHKHQLTDWHVDRLKELEKRIYNNITDLAKRPCVPPNAPQPQTPPPAPETPKSETVAPEHSSAMTPDNGGMLAANALAHNAWTLMGDYANFSPSTGSNADQWGAGARGQVMIGEGLAFDYGGAYHNVSGGGTNLNNWTADASVVWYLPNGRVGPTVGYQNNSETGFHADTWNYGGFGEYFTPHYTFGAKAGGFNTNGSFSNSNGYYVGGSVTGYICPNLSVLGGVDYTHFSPSGGSGETDWTVRGTWRPWDATPVAFWGGYTYTSFSPGSFNVSTISVGVMIDLGNGQTLIDSDRGSAIINQAAFGPLSLKF